MRRLPLARAFGLFLILFPAEIGIAAPASATPPVPYRLIGYTMHHTDPARIDPAKLTHLIYSFALVRPSGDLYFSQAEAPRYVQSFVALKAKNPQLKILLSVGGWGADNFSDAALTDASRERFARSAVALLREHHLDGLDVDWEYPGQPGPGIGFRPEDRQNFTLLLKTLRERFDEASAAEHRVGDSRYTLTIASSDGVYFEHVEMPVIHAYLDWVNVMTYDRFGAWSRTTGHHTALFLSHAAPAGTATVDSAIRQHLQAGVPRSKLVVGAAFYGRGWTGVKPAGNGLFQPCAKSLKADLSYPALATSYIDRGGFRRYWDANAQAPYLWNAATSTFISYEDPESLRAKASYVKQERLGGIMYWEQRHDPDGVLLAALHHELQERAPSRP